MTVTGTDPLWMASVEYQGEEDRWLMEALASDGIVSAGDLRVTQRAAGTNMSVDVAPGYVFVPGTDVLNQGTYLCKLPSPGVNVPIDAAPSIGTSRYDLVVAEVRDGNVNLGANYDWQLRVVKGAAASSPIEPTVPPTAVVLARVHVPYNTTAITTATHIVDRRVFAKDWAVGASGNLPRGRPRSVVIETNTGIIRRGNVDGTWTDIRGGQPTIAGAAGPIFGTLPSLASTVFREAIFGQLVGAINGRGNITLPFTFAGIMHFSAQGQLNTTPVIVGHRTDNPGEGTTTATNIPVTIWNMGQPLGDPNMRLNGNVVLLCRVVGW